MKKQLSMPLWARVTVAAAVAALAARAWLCLRGSNSRSIDRNTSPRDAQELLVTGYCNCEKCCGWRKKWFLFGTPVYNYGKMKGLPKTVGITASGTIAAKGTIAADPEVYPFGTRMEIPGYGVGVVQDTGGAIKGSHIDLWFPTHKDALAWGAKKLKVKVEKPKGQPKKPKATEAKK